MAESGHAQRISRYRTSYVLLRATFAEWGTAGAMDCGQADEATQTAAEAQVRGSHVLTPVGVWVGSQEEMVP